MINLVDTGAGQPPIVFIHGFTCGLSDWDEQLRALSGSHRCIAVDLPGHGASAAPREATVHALAAAVVDVLDVLDLPPAVLVGHSMGCRIVSETYRQAPQRACAVVYVDGSLLAPGDADEAVRRNRDEIDRIGMAAMTARLYDGFFVDTTPAAVRDRVRARLPHIDLEFARRLWLDLVRWDAVRSRAVLDAVAVPALVIQSTALDPQLRRVSLVPGQGSPWSDEVMRRVQEATLEIVPGVGHFPMFEAPQATSAALARFIARL